MYLHDAEYLRCHNDGGGDDDNGDSNGDDYVMPKDTTMK
jgi:hypothetical protein